MQPVLTAQEMQAADRAAIETLHISEARLMELAGRECLRLILDMLERKKLDGCGFLILCGKGNNGGDGFVLARHLLNYGAAVDVVLLYPPSILQGVNREGFATLQAYEAEQAPLRIFEGIEEALPFVEENHYTMLIDAMTGTGLRLARRGMELAPPLSDGIELLNRMRHESNATTLAIDIPSGLEATTGFAAQPVVEADVTVTMAFLKRGFLLNDGPECAGDVKVAEISIPTFLTESASCRLIDQEFAAEHFLLREPSSAKQHNGKVLMIVGSQSAQHSMLGAAILAAKAAIKSGIGYLCCSLPQELVGAMHLAVPEAVLIGRDVDVLTEKIAWADSVLIGCGLGRNAEALELVEMLLQSETLQSKKLILDADALFALSTLDAITALQKCNHVLLTPHYGELSRLCNIPIADIAANPIEIAHECACNFSATMLLKGNPTVIANGKYPILLNNSGTEALATAGSGDVLAGLIASLAAKGATLPHAAAAATWFHGRAGDLAHDVASLVTATMVADAIAQAIGEVFEVE
uniref:Bifunctional NAD(P)H-hydrate repair enzyme n=1 Tax=Chlorobium chlorochromatii (strain CaD3) TaxID=340177 RepID=Q3ARU3_CHLCH